MSSGPTIRLPVYNSPVLTVIVAALVSSTVPLSAIGTMAPYPPVYANQVHFDGPAPIEFTVGTIRVYSIRSDWKKTIERLRHKLKGQSGFEEFAGFSGMRWAMNSADHSFHWWNGKSIPAIGVYRDFKARAQVVKDTYAATFPRNLAGIRARGWITVLTFDGRTHYKKGVSVR